MSRGQASVELLLVALIVLAGSIAIASYYTNINDSVTATALLKVKVVEKTSGLSYFAYIEKIEPKVSGSTINFTLIMKSEKTPAELQADLELDSIDSFIEGKTKQDIVINLTATQI